MQNIVDVLNVFLWHYSLLPLTFCWSSRTFLGGGGGFCEKASLTASAADSGSLFRPFLESVSDRTTKKWWHFSHLTNRVDAANTRRTT